MQRISFVSLDFPAILCKTIAPKAKQFPSVFLCALVLGASAAAQIPGNPIPGCPANSSFFPCAYVANSSADTVTVLSNNNTALTPDIFLAEGGGPTGVAITPDNSTVYVAEGSNGTVEVIATATNTVAATIGPLTGEPSAIAITPNGRFAYVTEPGLTFESNSAIDVIDTSNNTLGTPITSGVINPMGIAITPNGAFAYVADECSSTGPACVDVIRLSNNQVIKAIPLTGTSTGQFNSSIAITADGAFAYVLATSTASLNDVQIYVIDTSLNTEVTLQNPLDIGEFLTSDYGLAIAPNKTLYAGIPSGTDSQRETTVYTVATSTNTFSSQITVGQNPTGLAVGRSGGIVYVTNAFDGTVSIIGTRNNTVNLSAITVGAFPQGVAAMRVSALPLISEPLVPSATPSGGAGFTLTVNGTGFAANAVVNWNGAPLANTFVNQGQLTASVPAGDIASFATPSITVNNPGPGGGTSNVVPFTVTSPTASLTFGIFTDPVGIEPDGIVTADFNGDGKADLAVANFCGTDVNCDSPGTVSILLGNGDGTFTVGTSLPTAIDPVSAVAGDFNGDGKLDLAVVANDDVTCEDGSSTCSEIDIFLGNGDGTFTSGTTVTVFNEGANPGQLITGDFNGDGKLDLALATSINSVPSVFVFPGNGDGTFGSSSGVAVSAIPTALVAGDFNSDGILDLAVAEASSPWVEIFLGNGDGTFRAGSALSGLSLVTPQSITAGDFDGDGNLDLAVADSASMTPTVLLGNGQGAFAVKAGQPAALQDLVFVTTADFNGDGKLDLALVGSGGSIFFDLGNGDGIFQGGISTSAGSLPVAAAFADFNADGRLDLAVANSGDNTVSIIDQSGAVSLSTLSLPFGNQIINTTSAAQNVTLTNTGSAPLFFGPITTGTGFAQTNNCPSTGPALVLVAGAFCTFQVTFTPNALGPFEATLGLGLNLPNSSVLLTGTGRPIPVQITTQPVGQTINAGQTATLTVTATGTAPLTYQWFIGASGTTTDPVSGATSASFTTPALAVTTSYWVRVTNGAGSKDSNAATITVIPLSAPQITTQPLGQMINSGQTAALTVVATGTAPLTYQWFQGSSGTTTNPISGATSTSFTTPALSATTSYWVRVSNVVGSKDSNTATITVVSNAAPTCSNPTFAPGASGLQVTFTATCSTNTVGTSINWGDKSALTVGSTPAVSATHTYAVVGPYSLTLTATDNLDRTGTPTMAQVTLISAQAPPPVFAGQSSDTPLMLTAPPGTPPQSNPEVKFVCTTATPSGGTAQSASSLGLTCTSDPATMTLTDTPQAVTISIQTTGTAAELQSPGLRHLAPFYASFLPLPGLIFMGLSGRGRRKWLRYLALGLLVSLLVFAVSCGGGFTAPSVSTSGGGSGSAKATPAGKYFVTVVDVPAQGSAPTGFVQTSLIVPLTVTGQ